MNRSKIFLAFLCCSIAVTGLSNVAEAIYADKAKTIEFRAKIQTRASFRTEDSSGFTFPEVSAWDLVQHRNIAYIELMHDLKDLIPEVWYLKPFKWADMNVKYRLVGRFLFEGVYNYGPQQFQDVRNAFPDIVDDFKRDADLWEGYADFSRGPLWIRFGRQNMAWGETDLFRLLDLINPLDNTFGGLFEDLDDRRIPIVLLRTSYNLGNIGPISSLTLESFWNPTSWDNRVSPLAPYGTVYALPAPPPPPGVGTRIVEPDKDIDASRYGFRLQGVIADNYNFSLCHYRSYLDAPAVQIVLDPGPVQELIYWDNHVTGGSLSFWEPHINAIIRSEVAWFWHEPVFVPEENAPILFGSLAEPKIMKKNILRFSVGMDYQAWIRPLNKKQMFTFLVQYFGQWVPDFDDRMRQAAPEFPTGEFANIEQMEQTITLVATTTYRSGTIVPQLAVAYDPRGVWFVQPQVNFIFEPFRFLIQYSSVTGNQTSFGFFRDRDQISVALTVLF